MCLGQETPPCSAATRRPRGGAPPNIESTVTGGAFTDERQLRPRPVPRVRPPRLALVTSHVDGETGLTPTGCRSVLEVTRSRALWKSSRACRQADQDSGLSATTGT